ncbi:MAG: sugar ABC transporter ATP-binding protein, partial [Lachnospiraceae bacterium]|nr:sugar ABC transporter ATP-binding protein [Lachnospiraceae bacterium]
MSDNVVLSMKNISKIFPGVKALQHVDFKLREGEIHALMGENSAGKSTLIKVLIGVHSLDGGEIKMAGSDTPIINRSPQDAQKNGISTVYQEVNLCPNLTVAENLFIGREPKICGFIDWRKMNKKATELLKELDIDASATDKLEECSLAKQQMIAIARAVDMQCRVLILDEPTSSLDDEEVEKFEPVIEASGLGRKGSIKPFDFVVNKGEVVGLTGLLGSGRSELVRAIYGADKPDSGSVSVNGKKVKINSPLDA